VISKSAFVVLSEANDPLVSVAIRIADESLGMNPASNYLL
jgi:hypothetical protein